MQRFLIVSITLIAPAASVFAQSPPKPVVGCYAVKLGEWAPAMSLREDTIYRIPPVRIELRTDTITSGLGRGSRAIRPAPSAAPSYHRFSYYRPTEADSLELVWTSGYSGMRMRVARSTDGLAGWASTFWDFPRQTQRASVRLVQETC